MRLIRRNSEGEAVGLEVPLLILGGLLALALAGAGGAAVVASVKRPPPVDPTARMGPARNYVALPDMTIPVGGASGREMDVKLLVELDPTVDTGVMIPFETRIADRLGDRVREIGLDRLNGREGAQLLKSAVTSVVDREIRPVRVRDVLIEKLIIR